MDGRTRSTRTRMDGDGTELSEPGFEHAVIHSCQPKEEEDGAATTLGCVHLFTGN